VDTGQFMAVQAAGVAALESWAEFVPRNVSIFKERRDAAVRSFRTAGFLCDVPRAAMYLWLKLPEDIPSALFAERLLEDEGVVVMPGSSFGAGGEGFFRVSFITAPERIAEAARRAGKVLANLTAGVA
jgi:LL-diaminopimelate aminotransferase